MENVLFYHGKTVDGKRFTLAGSFQVDGDFDDLLLGIAICGDTDQFVKKTGRNKATGRLFKISSFKGKRKLGLYSSKDFAQISKVGFKKDYFVGNEIKIFIDHAKGYNKMTVKDLKKTFNLYNNNFLQ